LIGCGLTTKEIARQLHISPKTVDTHRLHIKEKLRLQTLPALMKYALRWGATQEMI
jgi:DNA-binding CsgD family transcriptional regulator